MSNELLSTIDINAISPMMRHYIEMKNNYPDCLLLYRLGDFYEMFFDDALIASKVLEITLTGRDCGLSERAPMCGVPYHAVDTYITKLIAADYKVAICEQLSDPKLCKGMVDRDVVRIITPGTVVEEEILDNGKNNYLACIHIFNSTMAIAWTDISTGELKAIERDYDRGILDDLLSSISPTEIICSDYVVELISNTVVVGGKALKLNKFPNWAFNYDAASVIIKKQFSITSLDSFSITEKRVAVGAIGALLEYLTETQKRDMSQIMRVELVSTREFMLIDHNTRRNLELTETMRSKKSKGSLMWAIDYTATNMGKRMLARLIQQPLQSEKKINNRLNAVDEIINLGIFKDISSTMAKVRDLERLITKLVYNSFTPKDCQSVLETLNCIPLIKNLIFSCNSSELKIINKNLVELKELVKLLSSALVENAPATLKDGGFIKRGYNTELDELISAKTMGKTWLAELEADEKEKTGIKNLKVGYNKVFGYYIEVTKSNINMVPIRYSRRQTLTNCERYITEELKEIEEKLLGASDKAYEIEIKIFDELRAAILNQAKRLQLIANNIAYLDCLNSFAIATSTNNYVKPIVSAKSKALNIINGRHPVVDKLIGSSGFIANDTTMNVDSDMIMVLTGPNMSGKSTYIRQVALICILAHIGCYVPAERAEIGIIDRIFTRVGASDDLLNSQSTFMVEMLEVANILNFATDKSLLILDEVGRGTSTCDGLSIAWSTLEYIANNIKAKTLFATHYYEICELENKMSCLKNYKVLVNDFGGNVVFLHKIARGAASRSFGIEVAEMAGVPQEVIKRAKAIAQTLDTNSKNLNYDSILAGDNVHAKSVQPNFLDYDNKIKKVLQDIDVNNISPMQALVMLSDIVKMAKE